MLAMMACRVDVASAQDPLGSSLGRPAGPRFPHAPAVLWGLSLLSIFAEGSMLHGLQVEFYILEYADALSASHLTWPLAVEYLAWCPVHGQSSLIRLLESLPLATSSDQVAMKAIQASPNLYTVLSHSCTGGMPAHSLHSQRCPCCDHAMAQSTC